MKRKLVLVAFLVFVGGITFSQPFINDLPVIAGMDSVTFSVESFQDNGPLFNHLQRTHAVSGKCSKSLMLHFAVDTTYVGEVLLQPIGLENSLMYSFTGYLYKGEFTACTSMQELSREDRHLVIFEKGREPQRFQMVRVREAPAPFR